MNAKTICRILETVNAGMDDTQRLDFYYFLEERYRDNHSNFVRSLLDYCAKKNPELAVKAWPGTKEELVTYVSTGDRGNRVLSQDEVDNLLNALTDGVGAINIRDAD